MVYSHVWPLSIHRCWQTNWNWTQINWIPPYRERMTVEQILSMFLIELYSVKQNLLWILEEHLTKISPSAHMYQQCASSCFYHMRDLWHIHRHIDLDSAKLFVITRLLLFTFVWYQGPWPRQASKYSEQLDPLGDKVTFIFRSVLLLHSLHWLPAYLCTVHACRINLIPFTDIAQMY